MDFFNIHKDNSILLFFIKVLLVLILFGVKFSMITAQSVPSKIQFAGMKLKITEDARKKIQVDVNTITKSKTYFKRITKRADLYFPIIERIFKEKGIPDDFKFLALQESNLISDAISSSDAVGFWQFKKESAIEVGLRIDDTVDERMNIVASTYGASKYLYRNNFFFNNWIFTLLSYNLGMSGAKNEVNLKYTGAKKMEINKKTHWYIIRFLAYKIAFEYVVGKYHMSYTGGEKEHSPDKNLETTLILLDFKTSNKTLSEIAEKTNIQLKDLKLYNKWLKVSKIPGDTVYTVLLPVKDEQNVLAKLYELNLENENIGNDETMKGKNDELIKSSNNGKNTGKIVPDTLVSSENSTDEIDKSDNSTIKNESILLTSNTLRAIFAGKDDNCVRLANKGGITINQFLKYNEILAFDEIIEGQIYYLQPKRYKALVPFHTVLEGETLWGISQQYGVKIRSIRTKNSIKKGEKPEIGEVLWLKNVKPVDN